MISHLAFRTRWRLPLARQALAIWIAAGALAMTSAAQAGRPSQSFAAPEIDPDLWALGSILVVGGAFVLTGRRRQATT